MYALGKENEYGGIIGSVMFLGTGVSGRRRETKCGKVR